MNLGDNVGIHFLDVAKEDLYFRFIGKDLEERICIMEKGWITASF
jgi:hypothetical protein